MFNEDEFEDFETEEKLEYQFVFLVKEQQLGFLSIKQYGDVILSASIDVKNNIKIINTYKDIYTASKEFNDAIKISEERGWKIVFRGSQPLWG